MTNRERIAHTCDYDMLCKWNETFMKKTKRYFHGCNCYCIMDVLSVDKINDTERSMCLMESVADSEKAGNSGKTGYRDICQACIARWLNSEEGSM